jgi:hypothetical protein
MAQHFKDKLRDAEGSGRAMAGFWFATAGDLISNSFKVRFEDMSNVFAIRSSFLLLAVAAAVGTMFGGGSIGFILLLGLLGGAIYQRETLFRAPNLRVSPMLVIAAGVVLTAVAGGLAAVPDAGGNARWGLIFLIGYVGVLTLAVGAALAMRRRTSD